MTSRACIYTQLVLTCETGVTSVLTHKNLWSIQCHTHEKQNNCMFLPVHQYTLALLVILRVWPRGDFTKLFCTCAKTGAKTFQLVKHVLPWPQIYDPSRNDCTSTWLRLPQRNIEQRQRGLEAIQEFLDVKRGKARQSLVHRKALASGLINQPYLVTLQTRVNLLH